MDAKTVAAASTDTAAFAEIKFRGRIGDLLGTKGLRNAKVKVRFVPESGKAKTVRSDGLSPIARGRRTLLVMVTKLPAPAAEVIVTTSLRRKLDTLRAEVPFLDREPELDRELEQTDARIGKAIDVVTDASLDAAETSARLERAKKRKARRRQRAKLRAIERRRAAAEGRLGVLNEWLKTLEADLRGPATRQCDDRSDNDGDSLVDFGFDKDPGCVMRTDDDEADAPMPLTCPSPGGTASVTGTINVPAGSTLERFIISLPPRAPDEPRVPIVDAPVTGASGGPYPLDTSVTQLCNYEFDFVYGYTVSNGALRVTVSVQNNGGYPGGEQLPMLLAAGTSR